ncbi:MAG: prephenate dehydratase, partial [bacterium]
MIDEYRKLIDEIDEKILELLNKRAELAIEIGKEKLKSNSSFIDISREEMKVKQLIELNKGPIPDASVRNIFREIISSSRALEGTLKIAFLGPEGTFTHIAALKRFGKDTFYFPGRSIPEVFSIVEKEEALFGVVPIENSTEGVVNYTLDMFMTSPLNIIGEIIIPISHNLIARPDVKEIKKIYSHPQAFGQCKGYLENNYPDTELIETNSTSKAAEMASKDQNSAAIASDVAAERFNLEVLASRIEDDPNNRTRFLIIGRNNEGRVTGKDKTMVMFSTAHKPGSLYNALRCFAENDINLTMIQSRPSREVLWEFVFFVEFQGHREDTKVKEALNSLREIVWSYRILG